MYREKELSNISDDEIPFEIPASWTWCHLNDIAESDLGKTMNKGQNAGELVPYLCSINVYWNKIDLSKKNCEFIKSNFNIPFVEISAKENINLSGLKKLLIDKTFFLAKSYFFSLIYFL